MYPGLRLGVASPAPHLDPTCDSPHEPVVIGMQPPHARVPVIQLYVSIWGSVWRGFVVNQRGGSLVGYARRE